MLFRSPRSTLDTLPDVWGAWHFLANNPNINKDKIVIMVGRIENFNLVLSRCVIGVSLGQRGCKGGEMFDDDEMMRDFLKRNSPAEGDADGLVMYNAAVTLCNGVVREAAPRRAADRRRAPHRG